MKEVTLPSGAVLKIGLAPFSDSKELFQAIMEEMKTVSLNMEEIDYDFLKNMLCTGFGSKRVEAAVNKCWAKCLYNGVRIDADTFESLEAREDYLTVYSEVAMANVTPFTKNLLSLLSPLMSTIRQNRESKLVKTTT